MSKCQNVSTPSFCICLLWFNELGFCFIFFFNLSLNINLHCVALRSESLCHMWHWKSSVLERPPGCWFHQQDTEAPNSSRWVGWRLACQPLPSVCECVREYCSILKRFGERCGTNESVTQVETICRVQLRRENVGLLQVSLWGFTCLAEIESLASDSVRDISHKDLTENKENLNISSPLIPTASSWGTPTCWLHSKTSSSQDTEVISKVVRVKANRTARSSNLY